jgi:large subunit ribosomal protein L10
MPSASILEEKKQLVDLLSEKIKGAKSFVLADYRGLTVEQDTEMRVAIRNAGLEYKVYKNTLTKLAAKANGYEALNEYLEGPTAIAFSTTDPVMPSKILVEYAKKFAKFEIKAGVVEGKVVNEVSIKEIAALPSREELIAKVLCTLNAPITGFVNVLNGNLRGLVVALNAIREKKEQ